MTDEIDIEDLTCDELEITHDILKWCQGLQKIYEEHKDEIKKEVLDNLKDKGPEGRGPLKKPD